MRRHLPAGLDLTALAGDRRRRRAGWIDDELTINGFVGDRSPANERDAAAASGSVVRGKGRVEPSRKKASGWAGFCFALLRLSAGQKWTRPTVSLETSAGEILVARVVSSHPSTIFFY